MECVESRKGSMHFPPVKSEGQIVLFADISEECHENDFFLFPLTSCLGDTKIDFSTNLIVCGQPSLSVPS